MLTSPSKSYGISLVIHVTLLAMCHVIHVSKTQRFVSSGKLQVISIECSPAATSFADQSVSVSIPLQPNSLSMNSSIDRGLPLESLDVSESLDVEDLPESMIRDALAPPPSSPQLPVGADIEVARRPPLAQIPEVTETQVARPRRLVHRISKPPAVAVPPVQQISGLSERESADLSKNHPPAYPTEAIRNKWEGVVMLRLQIAKSGKVVSVEVIESSGHSSLDLAAVKAVAQWSGDPARRWGQAIESEEILPIRFRL